MQVILPRKSFFKKFLEDFSDNLLVTPVVGTDNFYLHFYTLRSYEVVLGSNTGDVAIFHSIAVLRRTLVKYGIPFKYVLFE